MIPLKIVRGLERYGEHHYPTGDFLRSVLSGHLFEAALRADDVNGPLLHIIAHYVMRNLPSESWGSHEKVDAWLGITHGHQA